MATPAPRPSRRRSRGRFRSLAHAADTATTGVGHHLDRGDLLVVEALQPVAAALWSCASDPGQVDTLRTRLDDALARLDLVAGANLPRRFLLDLERGLDGLIEDARPDRAA